MGLWVSQQRTTMTTQMGVKTYKNGNSLTGITPLYERERRFKKNHSPKEDSEYICDKQRQTDVGGESLGVVRQLDVEILREERHDPTKHHQQTRGPCYYVRQHVIGYRETIEVAFQTRELHRGSKSSTGPSFPMSHRCVPTDKRRLKLNSN